MTRIVPNEEYDRWQGVGPVNFNWIAQRHVDACMATATQYGVPVTEADLARILLTDRQCLIPELERVRRQEEWRVEQVIRRKCYALVDSIVTGEVDK